MAFNVYSSQGVLRATSETLEYSGEHMGQRYVTLSFISPSPISFSIGDYVTYRNERFEMNVTPSIERQSSNNSYGGAIVYKSVRFDSVLDELSRCPFLDCVESNDLHYFSMPNVSVYCPDVETLANRIKYNLNRDYTGTSAWTVNVQKIGGVTPGKKGVSVSLDRKSCWDALALVKTSFDLDFIVRGRTITIGTRGTTIQGALSYGQGNGLLTLQRNTNDSQQVITRLRAYGSTRNMPARYYSSKGTWNVSVSWVAEALGNKWFELSLPFGSYFSNYIRFSVQQGNNVYSIKAERGEVTLTRGGQSVSAWKATENASYISQGTNVYRFTSGVDATSVPSAYYTPNIPNNIAIDRLMLPGFPAKSLKQYVGGNEGVYEYSEEQYDPYIDSTNKAAIGIRPYSMYFDGFDSEMDEIYPSLEGCTIGNLLDAGYVVYGNREDSIDQIVVGDGITDSGTQPSENWVNLSDKTNVSVQAGDTSMQKKVAYGDLPVGTYKISVGLICTATASVMAGTTNEITARVFLKDANTEKTIVNLTKSVTCVGEYLDVELSGSNVNIETTLTNAYLYVEFSVTQGSAQLTITSQNSVTISTKKYESGTFKVRIPDIGFDISDYVDDKAALSMKSGMCAGREFEIVKCDRYIESGTAKGYTLTCNRVSDIGLYFPYSGYNIAQGDKYVITGIFMPDVYVDIAAQRLLDAAKVYLANNMDVAYTYTPKIDNIYIQRQHDIATSLGNTSIHDSIHEGDILQIEDNSLISGTLSITIDKLTIKEGEGMIPQFSISLSDDKQVSLIQKIQNSIPKQEQYIQSGGGGNINIIKTTDGTAPSDSNVFSSLKSDDRFLRKDIDDETTHRLTAKEFVTGLYNSMISGGFFGMKNGKAYAELDEIYVRTKAYFDTIEISKIQYNAGKRIAGCGGHKITKVEEILSEGENPSVVGYRCYYKNDDEGLKISCRFVVNDLAICQEFNIQSGTSQHVANRRYWRRVTYVDNASGYFCLSNVSGEYESGSSTPLNGDDVCQLGNTTDVTRQNAIMESAVGANSPSYIMLKGINTFSLEGKDFLTFGYDSNGGANIFVGDRSLQNNKGSLKYTQANGLEVDGKVTVKSGSTGVGSFSDVDVLAQAKNNLLTNTSFCGNYQSLYVTSDVSVLGDTQVYSPSLLNWTAVNATAQNEQIAPSGCKATLSSGSILQTLVRQVQSNTDCILSFYAKGTSVNFSIASNESAYLPTDQQLTNQFTRYTFKFKPSSNITKFKLMGTCEVYSIQLEEGIVATEWGKSMYDYNKEIDEITKLEYLRTALKGTTSIQGGLILSSLIELGNYVDGAMQQVNAGMNGIYVNDNSIGFWAGGTASKADYAVNFFNNNPSRVPTQQELAQMAKFVVTHGGRAILNDIILRGYVYAKGGEFNGKVIATSGEFRGDVIAKNFYYESMTISSEVARYIDPSTDSSFIVLLRGNVFLPFASDYLGITFIVRFEVPQQYVASSGIFAKSGDTILVNDSSIQNEAVGFYGDRGVVQLTSVGGSKWVATSIVGNIYNAIIRPQYI